jgi:ABC-type polysaccharide/polyol phosphate transport system ATPase subunit
VLARELAGRHASGEPARPLHEPPAPAGPPAFTGLSCHVGAGQALGVLADDAEAGALLLRVLAGREPAAGGTLAVDGRILLLDALGDGLEAQLTVRENLFLFAAYVRASVSRVQLREAELLGLAAIADPTRELGSLPIATAVRLALVVALECAAADVLLVGDLPDPGDAGFRRWANERIAQRRHAGLAVIELRRDPAALLATPDRVAWLHEGTVVASGHPASVTEAAERTRIGLAR